MFLNSTVLDVVIGLVFVYLLFSLFCTALQELVAGWRRQRATYLRKGIQQILHDPSCQGLGDAFFKHPLIVPLLEGRKCGPSYLSPGTFTPVLKDLLASPELLRARLPREAAMPELAPVFEAFEAWFKTPGTAALHGAFAALEKADLAVQAGHYSDDLKRRTHLALQSELQVRQAVHALGVDLSAGATAGDANLEKWFTDAMERVSGWYKRRAQLQLGLIALVLVSLANADTLRIAHFLTRNPAAREALVAAARQEVAQPTLYTPTDPTTAPLLTVPQSDPDGSQARGQIANVLSRASALPIPLGWLAPDTDVQSIIDKLMKKAPGGDPKPVDTTPKEKAEELARQELVKKTAIAIDWASEFNVQTAAVGFLQAKAKEMVTNIDPKTPEAQKKCAFEYVLSEWKAQEAKRLQAERAVADANADVANDTAELKKAKVRLEKEATRRATLVALVQDPKRVPTSGWGWCEKILGLFLTVLACMLGAPFWFDLLTRFVNLRGSGPKPEEAKSPTPAPAGASPTPPAPTPGTAAGRA